MADGRFQPGRSGNPRGRPKAPRTLLLASLIEPHLADLVTVLLKKGKEGDVSAARALIERCVPPFRPESARVPIPGLAQATTPTEMVQAVTRAAGAGEISPTVATELLTALGAGARVLETDELRKRIEALEAKQQ